MLSIQRRRPIAEMNLIPLIDISLILVIIFMVLTPALIQSQLTVRLPKSGQAASTPSEGTVRVQISREGIFLIDNAPVRVENLERELTLRLASAAKKNLLVQADKTVPIEKVVLVLDTAKRLGVDKLGIGVTTAP